MSESANIGSFVVRIDQLPAQRQLKLGPTFVEKAIGTLPMRAVLERPEGDESIGAADSTIELYEAAPGVFVRGNLVGSLEVGCSRCIEPVTIAIDESIAVSYLPANEVPDQDAPVEDDDEIGAEDDVDLYPYEGEQIDLTKLFHERLILAVPFAPLCSETCKGLCTVCGANLNAKDCGCDRHVGDPRLAALRDIKISESS